MCSQGQINLFQYDYAVISNDGTIAYYQPAVYTTICDINTREFPFDEQTCNVQLTSWVYDGTQLVFSGGAIVDAELFEVILF